MAFKFGNNAVIKVNGTNDISTFTSSIEWTRTQDAGETTTYGNTSKTYVPGLHDGKFALKGYWDSTVTTGVRAIMLAALAANAVGAFTIEPEGTGTGKASDTGNAIITSYVESVPVGGVIEWTADFQVTGVVTTTAQS